MTTIPSSPPTLDRRGTIEVDQVERAALLDLYHIHLAAVERLERLLHLPPAAPVEQRAAVKGNQDERGS